VTRRKQRGIVNLLGSHTVCQSCGMDTPPATTKYKNHRFPVEIISHAVWLYFRFCLSFRAGIVNLSGSYRVWQSCGMDTPPAATKYKNHRFPVEIISHAVWLYFRFCLSFRDVEELLLERGVIVTYEAIRK
jgi:hypothetical protein